MPYERYDICVECKREIDRVSLGLFPDGICPHCGRVSKGNLPETISCSRWVEPDTSVCWFCVGAWTAFLIFIIWCIATG